jgi:hypothetical protein
MMEKSSVHTSNMKGEQRLQTAAMSCLDGCSHTHNSKYVFFLPPTTEATNRKEGDSGSERALGTKGLIVSFESANDSHRCDI